MISPEVAVCNNPVSASQNSQNGRILVNFLDDDFYKDVKSEISYSNLLKLSKQSKRLEVPSLYGKFLNDRHYMETLDLILSSTDETIHRGLFYSKKILPHLEKVENLLDVGSGNGKITKMIGESFKEITLLDSCSMALDQVSTMLGDKRVLKINGSVCESRLPGNYYDLIMMSHVLYYVDPALWINATQKCYQSLRPGGVMVVVLSGAKLGKASLMQHFSGHSIDIESYTKACAREFGAVEVFLSNEKFCSCDLPTMLHIAGFLLCDVNAYAKKEDLEDYLIQNHKKSDSSFEITTQQEFIVIRKRG